MEVTDALETTNVDDNNRGETELVDGVPEVESDIAEASELVLEMVRLEKVVKAGVDNVVL